MDPAAFRRDERTLVSVWGHVRRPGVYEVPLGTSIRRIVDAEARGAGDGIGFVFPGGPSTPPLTPGQIDTPLDPAALRAAGSALGTAAIGIVGASTPPLALSQSLAGFFERESCGQCPPCTMGTVSLARIARAMAEATARPRDIADLDDVGGFMAAHGYCAHCRTGASVVGGLLHRLAPASLAGTGPRPAPGTGHDFFGPESPERAAIEAVIAGLASVAAGEGHEGRQKERPRP